MINQNIHTIEVCSETVSVEELVYLFETMIKNQVDFNAQDDNDLIFLNAVPRGQRLDSLLDLIGYFAEGHCIKLRKGFPRFN